MKLKKSLQFHNFSNTLLVLSGVLFAIIMAYKKIPIPGTAIEMSLQSLSVSILVITLGKKASWVMVVYLVLATMGLPVLAEGISNPRWFLAPSAGYYFGFLVSSIFLPRILIYTRPENFKYTWFTLSLNETSILFIGFLILSCHFGLTNAWWIGVWPFLFGASLKISVATLIYLFLPNLNKNSNLSNLVNNNNNNKRS